MTTSWLHLLSEKRLGSDSSGQRDNDTRSPFLVDVDRILFASSFRRLQDKTQVHPLASGSIVRTRLTHSLEVSSIARSLGYTIGRHIIKHNPDIPITEHDFGYIIQAAGLIHDIGNPPFGHQGEAAISNFFHSLFSYGGVFDSLTPLEKKDFLDFDGNAQGFRTVTRLIGWAGEGGLRLTLATLGSFLKYPRAALPDDYVVNKVIGDKKIGVFQSELETLHLLTDALGMIPDSTYPKSLFRRHPLSFLLEAADDICYSLADIEDAYNVGVLSFEKAEKQLASIARSPEKHMGDRNARLSALKKEEFYIVMPSSRKLEFLRGKAIANLIDSVVSSFISHEQAILHGTFTQELLQTTIFGKYITDCKFTFHQDIMKHRSKVAQELTGLEVIHEILSTLVEAFIFRPDTPKSVLVRRLLPDFPEALSLYETLQMITDYLCDLTDHQAVSFYHTLRGR